MNKEYAYITPGGLLLVAIGLFIRYHIARRRFNRRAVTGLQLFSSYGRAVLTTIAERLLNFIGTLCLLAGLLLLAMTGFNHHFKF